VVDLGTSITSKIPGPVGSVTTQTLQSVGSALDRIIPIRARAGTPGSASR
jgi:hypothetical protein